MMFPAPVVWERVYARANRLPFVTATSVLKDGRPAGEGLGRYLHLPALENGFFQCYLLTASGRYNHFFFEFLR